MYRVSECLSARYVFAFPLIGPMSILDSTFRPTMFNVELKATRYITMFYANPAIQ
jgi:hypothetical protein